MPKYQAEHYSLMQHMAGGGSRKLGLPGENGVIRYHWPVSTLSVDWVRQHWGAGRFQANWLVGDDQGRLSPRGGKSRVVDIVPAPARAARAHNGAAAASIGFVDEFGVAPSPAPPAPAPHHVAMPDDVAAMRVRAAEQIAEQRIKAQQDIFREQLDWQRRQSEDRYQQLEERMEQRLSDLERRGPLDDDAPESEWAWVKELVMPLAPHLKDLVPMVLARLGGGPGKVLPG